MLTFLSQDIGFFRIRTGLVGGALCLGLWFSSGALATPVKGLYTASIPVASLSKKDKVAAIQTGLKQVLLRLSGNPHVMTLPEVQGVLRKSQDMGVATEAPQLLVGIQYLRLFHHAHGKPGQIKFPFLIEAWHFCGFPA